ncbi:hypothetical protein PULV_b0392 [Pseudoalteromonas ulvae UL12]|nr:hypothetical protein [Pseudoalteromonas ulvae UL12]
MPSKAQISGSVWLCKATVSVTITGEIRVLQAAKNNPAQRITIHL